MKQFSPNLVNRRPAIQGYFSQWWVVYDLCSEPIYSTYSEIVHSYWMLQVLWLFSTNQRALLHCREATLCLNMFVTPSTWDIKLLQQKNPATTHTCTTSGYSMVSSFLNSGGRNSLAWAILPSFPGSGTSSFSILGQAIVAANSTASVLLSRIVIRESFRLIAFAHMR